MSAEPSCQPDPAAARPPARIDVIIPAYNYGRYLPTCVESVFRQTVAARAVIIDDASTDDTPEVARVLAAADPRVTYVRHPRNLGHIATFNEGIGLASADYMLILSADDFVLPGALDRAVAVMDAHPDVVLAVGDWLEMDPVGLEVPPVPPAGETEILTGQQFIERSGPRNLVATPTAVTRTAVQKRVGGYRGELTHAGDMEMWLRLAVHGSVAFIDAIQAVYRRHPQNMSLGYDIPADLEQRAAALRSFLPLYRAHFPDGDLMQRRLFRRMAEDSVAHAHLAFNIGCGDQCDRILAFAETLHPGIGHSVPARRLAIKRWLGPGVWSFLAPALSWGSRSTRCG